MANFSFTHADHTNHATSKIKAAAAFQSYRNIPLMFKKKLHLYEEREWERCCGFVALRRMNPQAARQPSQKTTIFLTSTLMQPQHTHTHTGAHTHMHTHTHRRTHTHIHTHWRHTHTLEAHTQTHTHRRTHTDAHTHTHTHTHTQTHTHTHTHTHTQRCTNTHIHTHTHTDAHTQMHTHTHTHTHTHRRTHMHTLEAHGSKDIYGLRGVNSPTSSDLWCVRGDIYQTVTDARAHTHTELNWLV